MQRIRATSSPWTELENVPTPSCRRGVGLRLLAGDFPLLSFALCFLQHRSEIAEGHPCECDTMSDRSLGGATTARSNSVWTHTNLSDSGEVQFEVASIHPL